MARLYGVTSRVFKVSVRHGFQFLRRRVFMFRVLSSYSRPGPGIFVPCVQGSGLAKVVFMDDIVNAIAVVMGISIVMLRRMQGISISLLRQLRYVICPYRMSFTRSPNSKSFKKGVDLWLYHDICWW